MIIQKIMVLLLLTSFGYTQSLGEWRWADDTSEFTMDKEAHFVGSAGAYFFFRHKGFTQCESIQYSIYLGLSKEVIDALLPWEEYGRWGGDGFSKYDLMYDILGVLTAWGIDELIKPKKENKGVAVKLDNNRVMFEWKLN